MSRTITYEPVEDEEILFQPQGMTVEYVAKSNKEIKKSLNTERAWYEAFINSGAMKGIKSGELVNITKNYITINHTGKIRKLKIRYSPIDNCQYICFQSIEKCWRSGSPIVKNQFMRPIHYDGKILLNHFYCSKKYSGLGDIEKLKSSWFFSNEGEPHYGDYCIEW